MAAKLPAHQQREALIRAGFELAEKSPTARLTAPVLAKHAGLSASSLGQQFGDLDRFAETLQNLHYEEIRRHTLAAMLGLDPGIDRILRGAQAYFDFAFTRRGLRSWMSGLRMHSSILQSQWRVDNQLYVQFLATEMALIGWPHPLVGARLFIAAVLELTRHEQQEGRRLPAARRALEGFLRTHEHAAGFV